MCQFMRSIGVLFSIHHDLAQIIVIVAPYGPLHFYATYYRYICLKQCMSYALVFCLKDLFSVYVQTYGAHRINLFIDLRIIIIYLLSIYFSNQTKNHSRGSYYSSSS
eukprot:500124_1